ncbi:MAG: hypothetical protein F6J93_17475 [Oscillatoria sp. SIO1A7]|nr:hypothetical protein [Oscillatoria sp. SIO1A7]
MRSRALIRVAALCAIALASWLWMPPAHALTEIKLFDISYEECSEEIAEGAVTSDGSGSAANCFIVSGKTKNTSGKTVYDADIFGRIYDANNNNVLPNRTRLGNIEEVPPGIGNFSIRISVAATLPTPLKLKKFKARGFGARVKILLPD